MGSTRLPGKVLETIDGAPMLQRVFERVIMASAIGHCVVATSADPKDQAIVEFCKAREMPVVAARAEGDVLGRFIDTLPRELSASSPVVRITADCPLVDPGIIDAVCAAFARGCDYASNVWPVRTFPDGLDVEVISTERLRRLDKQAVSLSHREHVTRLLRERPREAGVMRSVVHDVNLGHLRWTVDTADDLEFARAVYRYFAPNRFFGWQDVLAVPDFAARVAA